MALKRQQAAEDAIALHLASAETGTSYDYLPPGRIYGMQVTSPEPDSKKLEDESSATTPTNNKEKEEQNIQVSPASIDMLNKLFPNKKRAVLELVLKRCNHDLLKAIEHFNSKQCEDSSIVVAAGGVGKKEEGTSAFKPVKSAHQSTIPFLASNKVFMHSLYPFLPLFNPQPVLPSPLYVPGFCECEQCKHGGYRLQSGS